MPIAYKLFRVMSTHKGKIFPLFVNANKEIPIDEWIEAESGERLENGKVKSKLGPLAYRPGWHLSDIPLAIHIGIKNSKGNIEFINPKYVWCECEYSNEIDYTKQVQKNGTYNNKFHPRDAYLKEIPKNGCYRYKTSPNMLGEWIIAGKIKINRILEDQEVNDILKSKGYTPMERYGGPIDLSKYDLKGRTNIHEQ